MSRKGLRSLGLALLISGRQFAITVLNSKGSIPRLGTSPLRVSYSQSLGAQSSGQSGVGRSSADAVGIQVEIGLSDL